MGASDVCDNAPADKLFLTKQGGKDNFVCDDTSTAGVVGCSGNTINAATQNGRYLDPSIPAFKCSPLNAMISLGFVLSDGPAGWSFDAATPGNELNTVTKPGPGGGGVLCCRNM